MHDIFSLLDRSEFFHTISIIRKYIEYNTMLNFAKESVCFQAEFLHLDSVSHFYQQIFGNWSNKVLIFWGPLLQNIWLTIILDNQQDKNGSQVIAFHATTRTATCIIYCLWAFFITITTVLYYLQLQTLWQMMFRNMNIPDIITSIQLPCHMLENLFL